jgi:hypothetical protein
MELVTMETVRGLILPHTPPCISIYQPTHRCHPDNQQDPIRFKNLIRTVEESLAQKYRDRDTKPLLEPLRKLAEDSFFWNHTLDGLAVLASAEITKVFPLQRTVSELAVVADSFHIKPLLRVLQSADRYQVLCLTRESAWLYEGNRYALDKLEVPGLPKTLTEALGEQVTEPHLTYASHGSGTAGTASMIYGQGSRKDEIDKDTERYFRAVDRAVLTHVSKPSGLPLLLVALSEHQPVFRQVSQNPALLPNGVLSNPEALSAEQLRDACWAVMEPQYLARLAKLSEQFGHAVAHEKGTADLSDAARAAVAGRVGTLLIEADRVIPGKLDTNTGTVEFASLDDPEVDDLLDDLAEVVLRQGGDIVIVPKERMPTTTGLAAMLRY